MKKACGFHLFNWILSCEIYRYSMGSYNQLDVNFGFCQVQLCEHSLRLFLGENEVSTRQQAELKQNMDRTD